MNYLSYWGDLYTWQNIFRNNTVFVCENLPYCEFPKGILNRTQIVSSQGLHQLSIPIQGGRKNNSIFKNIRIEHTTDWQRNHYRTIMSCYGKSPWWKEYEGEIQKVYQQKKIFLFDWNIFIYEWVANLLECKLNYISEITTLGNEYNKNDLTPYQQVFGNIFYDGVFILDAILCQGEKELKYYLKKV